MAELQVERIPALSDNYMFLLFDPVSGTSGIVDPADAGPVIEALERHDRSLDWILNTHHHADHTAGNGDLMQRYGARLAGPAGDHSRIAGMDILLREGEAFTFGSHRVDILETPGHTSGHVSLHFADAGMLFSGDTLFALGCGRLFEGSPAQMWESLSKYAAMPDETIVWCGHEYTLANARFALTVDPTNSALKERAEHIEKLRAENKPTAPTTIGEEMATNPFLRWHDPAIRRNLGMENASDEAVFAEIRKRKDLF